MLALAQSAFGLVTVTAENLIEHGIRDDVVIVAKVSALFSVLIAAPMTMINIKH